MGERRDRGDEIDLSIIIVNWHSAEYVRLCVSSVVAETRSISYEIIVVDNASFDDCERRLAALFPKVQLVQSGSNSGFGRANNIGASRARGKALLFLNPDTQVRNAAIQRMYAQLCQMPKPGVVGCRLLNTDGSLQTSCVQALPTVLNQVLDAELLRRCVPRARLWGTRALFSHEARPVEVEAVSGACMMLRRKVFESLGGFSPAFFMYGEDLDLCARARRAGLTNAFVGDCEVVHHGGGSARKTQSTFSAVMMCESIALLLRRLKGPFSSATYRLALTIAACVRLVILGVASPAWLVASGPASWSIAWRKWLAVLGWGLGLNRPVVPGMK